MAKSNVYGVPLEMKKPLKWVEIPLYKFNEVAIPHHVELLHRHRESIEKFQLKGEWEKAHREQVNATRVVKQLKDLLVEIDSLRIQVVDSDLEQFDKHTEKSRQVALNAIKTYLVITPGQANAWLRSSPDEGESSKSVEDVKSEQVQLTDLKLEVKNEEDDLARKEACLHSWQQLCSDADELRQLFADFTNIVKEQQESITKIEDHIEASSENVTVGQTDVANAVKMKSAVYPLAGAVLGGCIGGPIGLLAGVKIGGLAAVGCALVGFTGGTILKKKEENSLHLAKLESLYSPVRHRTLSTRRSPDPEPRKNV
ncbi:syntaxin-17 isoform X1 [Hetaerina americana]|uniref:syntaxin-17 isoform X1 n=1 Tax=Hetaerina americana TaxID=62018 RepID=UPI003A7F31C4